MSSSETNVNNLKINRGTYDVIQNNLSSIGENELIITTDKQVPIPTASDSGKVIGVDSNGEFVLQTPGSGMTNPMTTQGDLIVGGTDGVANRLPKGTTGQVLKATANGVEWANDNEGMTNPMTTSQDLIIGGTSGTPTRLAKGSNGFLLGVNGSGNLAYTTSLPYLTTAPTSANTDGLKLVVLNSEPATKYDGYFYIVISNN